MKKVGPYTKKVIEYFKKPHNYGRMKDADGVGKVGNIVCGDVMWLYIKVGKDKRGREIIKDIRFETFGCVAAIATSSVITDLAKGETLTDAMKIDRTKIVKSLGGLPPIKLHCSVLAASALTEAIYDYLSKQERQIPKELEAKHRQIEKEKKKTEKRYKEWTKTEEEIHKKEI
ncbi:iron-sulfur cluster assembly scaffold protein [bacterium (Candidatus Moisslbacteria) CG02_land_8_20_14_3_00_36_53]|nr:iron-sulfur cluster assembly scaffold protein [Candidatus Kuenenbacteria bacterium]OIP76436.1 MAG: iron-sulfur cluster assembly scaffold protein [Parcubacteria group bacterium CG2_30_36_38]PIV45873.1 MAG: iron-sulfur cluster assembly scaffold protein [bacterium (Candidatus Moisslbacteria) CG02_land_8_20_14_3_00_36_53]PIZ90222.1 MAG: iron-sulfur cluster assembly scaffold protein [bacterium (Candidatus Moisslbacteria) CG_4_10_14_0_2_um_filter_36_61]PJC00812.1 MAG: iron-sulfur cluster assembly 